jgi:hypothetical protein
MESSEHHDYSFFAAAQGKSFNGKKKMRCNKHPTVVCQHVIKMRLALNLSLLQSK